MACIKAKVETLSTYYMNELNFDAVVIVQFLFNSKADYLGENNNHQLVITFCIDHNDNDICHN